MIEANFAAIILSGGESRRMGGSPKALLPYEGETFADRLIGLFEPICRQIVVVVGPHADTIRAGVRRHAEWVANPNWTDGQLTSLQAGLQTISPTVAGFFFSPVDYPAIRNTTVTRLADSFQPTNLFTIPRHAGKHGHPVLCSAEITAHFLALPPSAAARDLVHQHRERSVYVDVEDDGIVRDVDLPSDYAALLERADSL